MLDAENSYKGGTKSSYKRIKKVKKPLSNLSNARDGAVNKSGSHRGSLVLGSPYTEHLRKMNGRVKIAMEQARKSG